MKLILLTLSFVLGILSSGYINPSIKKSRLAQFILGALSIYGFLLLVANFNEDSLRILNLFGFASEHIDIPILLNEYFGDGTIEAAIIEQDPSQTLENIEPYQPPRNPENAEVVDLITTDETSSMIEPSLVLDEVELQHIIEDSNDN